MTWLEKPCAANSFLIWSMLRRFQWYSSMGRTMCSGISSIWKKLAQMARRVTRQSSRTATCRPPRERCSKRSWTKESSKARSGALSSKALPRSKWASGKSAREFWMLAWGGADVGCGVVEEGREAVGMQKTIVVGGATGRFEDGKGRGGR